VWLAASAIVVWVGAAVTAGQGRGGQGRDIWVENLPPGQGKEMAAQRCNSCHTLERTVQLRQSKEGWESTVFDMIGRGAPIFLEEATEIIDYFGSVFGPGSPPFTDVNRASREELVKVPGLTAELADRLLTHRKDNGPVTSRDQVREILGLAEKPFENIRYYLHAGGQAQ
jgi:hypothetical protein